jgi:hypothetical protein
MQDLLAKRKQINLILTVRKYKTAQKVIPPPVLNISQSRKSYWDFKYSMQKSNKLLQQSTISIVDKTDWAPKVH